MFPFYFFLMKSKTYLTVGTVPKSNRKIVDKGNIETTNREIPLMENKRSLMVRTL